jgi:hypothetical protein
MCIYVYTFHVVLEINAIISKNEQQNIVFYYNSNMKIKVKLFVFEQWIRIACEEAHLASILWGGGEINLN